MTKFYVSIPSVTMFTTEKETRQEVLDQLYIDYNLTGFEDVKETDTTLFFTTTFENQPFKTQISISLEEGIDLDGWQESMDELYQRQQNEIDVQAGKFDWLLEFAYQGESIEPSGYYSKTTIDKVKASLLEDVDANGYFEELEDGCLKFISPKNKPSYWIVGQY